MKILKTIHPSKFGKLTSFDFVSLFGGADILAPANLKQGDRMSNINDAYPNYSPKPYPMNHCLSSHYENTTHVWFSVLLKDTSAVANTEG